MLAVPCDPQTHAFHQPHTGAVHQTSHQSGHLAQQPADLVAAQHHRQLLAAPGMAELQVEVRLVQHLLVEEHQGVQCLILRAGDDLADRGQGAEIAFDIAV